MRIMCAPQCFSRPKFVFFKKSGNLAPCSRNYKYRISKIVLTNQKDVSNCKPDGNLSATSGQGLYSGNFLTQTGLVEGFSMVKGETQYRKVVIWLTLRR